MSNMEFPPRKSMLTRDGITSRPLLPKEKDDYTIMWFSSLSKSYIGLPMNGALVMVVSVAGDKLFTEMIGLAKDFYLVVSPATVSGGHTLAKLAFGIGGLMLMKGLMNIKDRK
ncbi:MAG: hypothetical protein PHG66_03400 [Candidatus Colwellbacteria bacterium]|nr:hypothetical protein [Candidatus Colwellbacteria bacterium]